MQRAPTVQSTAYFARRCRYCIHPTLASAIVVSLLLYELVHEYIHMCVYPLEFILLEYELVVSWNIKRVNRTVVRARMHNNIIYELVI